MAEIEHPRIEYNVNLRRCGGFDELNAIEDLRGNRSRRGKTIKGKDSAQKDRPRRMA